TITSPSKPTRTNSTVDIQSYPSGASSGDAEGRGPEFGRAGVKGLVSNATDPEEPGRGAGGLGAGAGRGAGAGVAGRGNDAEAAGRGRGAAGRGAGMGAGRGLLRGSASVLSSEARVVGGRTRPA